MPVNQQSSSQIKKRLHRQRTLKIRKICEQKLSDFGYTTGSVDTVKFAKFLGADLKYAPYDDGDLAGMLVRENNKRPVIAVNSSHPPNRRRFTIAHECGHLVLHTDQLYIDKKLSIHRRDRTSTLALSIEEIEANQFAAEILMPKNNIWLDIKELDIDIEDDADTIILSKKYKVSRQAMSYRIYNLMSEYIFRD